MENNRGRHINTTELLAGIPNRLKRAIRQRGMTRKELSEKVGVSEVSMSRYCAGTRTPNAENLLAIAFVLNVSADYLLGLDEDFNGNEKGVVNVKSAVKYCEDAASAWADFQLRAMENIRKGDSYGGSFEAVAFGAQQEKIYRYEIPSLLRQLADQEEKRKKQGKEVIGNSE